MTDRDRAPYARRKGIGFIVLLLVIAAGVYYGLHVPTRNELTQNSSPPADTSTQGQILSVRENSPAPTCDSPLAIQTVQGQLVRTEKARVVGLSNVAEIGQTSDGGRSCQATINLDAGTDTVKYTINGLGSGQKGWQLNVRH